MTVFNNGTPNSQVSKLSTSRRHRKPVLVRYCATLGKLEVHRRICGPACARTRTSLGRREETTLVPNANAAANALEIMQRNAQ